MYNYYCSKEENKHYKNNIKHIAYVDNEKIISKYELTPLDSRNSFCGKALLLMTVDNIYCLSYDTIVCGIDRKTGELHKYWNDWSATTMRHINSFLHANGKPTLNKKTWLAL